MTACADTHGVTQHQEPIQGVCLRGRLLCEGGYVLFLCQWDEVRNPIFSLYLPILKREETTNSKGKNNGN